MNTQENEQPQNEKERPETFVLSEQSWYSLFEKGVWVFLFLVGITLAAAISLALFYYAV